MERHHITKEQVSDQSNLHELSTYVCSKCGRNYGKMTFEQSQFIDLNGCPGVKTYTEPVPSPFQAETTFNNDNGHEGLLHDLRAVLHEADQYAFTIQKTGNIRYRK
jgi:hypothetical protein